MLVLLQSFEGTEIADRITIKLKQKNIFILSNRAGKVLDGEF
jgi:hypothetical protein